MGIRDIGRVKAGLRDGVNRAVDTTSKMAGSTMSSGDDGAGSSAFDSARLAAWLESHRPPPGGITEPWSLGIGDLLAESPGVPDTVRSTLRRLNSFAGLSITPSSLTIDGDEVKWSAMQAIRTRKLSESLASSGFDTALGALPIPWFPGRNKLLTQLSEGGQSLLRAALARQASSSTPIMIPAQIEHRGMVRSKQATAGLFTTVVLADSVINDCLVRTAQANGIAVTPLAVK